MSDVYEWRRFEPGDRVRVRLSPECQSKFVVTHPTTGERLHRGLFGHERAEDGAVGKVIDVNRSGVGSHGIPSDGHFYEVDFDVLVRTRTCWLAGAKYAAAELDPFEAES